MFKIGEFSKLTQVSVRMLRYYDETGLLKPAQIDEWTGYRMYSAEQIKALNKIIYLRDSGFNIAEITSALNSDNDYAVLQLEKKYNEIQAGIQAEKIRLEKIETAKKALLHEKDEMHYHITIKSVPSYLVLSLRKVIPDYYAEGLLWHELSQYAKQHKVETSGDTFTLYHDEDYREKDVDVELCAFVKRRGESTGSFTFRDTEPVPIMACTMVYGHFANIAGAYLSFAGWLSQNSQYKMTSPSRQIVHRGPWNEKNEAEWLTELQIPLENVK